VHSIRQFRLKIQLVIAASSDSIFGNGDRPHPDPLKKSRKKLAKKSRLCKKTVQSKGFVRFHMAEEAKERWVNQRFLRVLARVCKTVVGDLLGQDHA
jgi:hypothetical protein